MPVSRLSVAQKIGVGAASVAVAVGVLVGGFAYWLPRSGVARDLQAALSQKLGREVDLSGGISLTLFPVFGVTAKGFSVANIPGGQAAHLVEADAINVGLEPLSLLTGHVRIRNISLTSPRIHLEKLSDGRVNWSLGTGGPAPTAPSPAWLKDISIDRLSISSGQIAFADFKANGREAIDQINVAITLTGLDQPATATGSFALAGEPAKIVLTLDAPRAVINGKATGLHLALESKPITLKLDGAGELGGGPMSGAVDVRGPSLRGLAKVVGKPLAAGPGLGPFSVKGRLEKAGPLVRLSAARLALDHLTADGEISIDTSKATPAVTGDIHVPILNMNPYLGPDVPLRLDVPWPSTPISLAGLRAFDADLTVSADAVQFRRLHLTNTALRAVVTDGTARVVLERMSLYGGSGAGRLVVADAAGGGRYGGQFQLRGVEAKGLLSDLMGLDRIVGAASGSVSLTTTGGSVDALIHGLSGQMQMTVDNGAVVGVDMAAVSRNVASALTGGAIGPDARTPFSVAGGTFSIDHGVAATKNLALSGPGVAVAGVGSIDLGGRTADMVIKPQGAAKVGGRRLDLGAVPFRVHGPLAKLSYEPDLGGVAETLIGQQVGQIVGKGGGDLSGLFGALGGGSSPPPTTPSQRPSPTRPAPKSNPALDLLDRLAPH